MLPKFSKVEICKIFGVKRIICFSVDFAELKGMDETKAKIQEEL